MAQIRLRIELNKGRIGAPLEKLSDVSRQMDKFLRALAQDLHVEVKRGDWLAVNFENGSVKWDAALQVDVPSSVLTRFNDAIEVIADYDPETEGANGLVSDATLLEYGKIGTCIETDEVISVGLYATPSAKKPKKWRQIGYRETSRIRHALETPIYSHGSVQGLMHSLFKEGNAPHFQIRELATGSLIRCLYKPELYPEVVRALKDRSAIVFVSGTIKYDRVKRQPEELRVERFDQYEPLSDDELASFFGSAPRMTNDVSTGDFIGRIRGDG